MLYLHCGWPRASTTSFQTVLYERRDRLQEAGLLYPDEWRLPTGITHHGLAEMLRDSLESDHALDDFRRFLDAHVDRDILFSGEALTNWVKTRRCGCCGRRGDMTNRHLTGPSESWEEILRADAPLATERDPHGA